jgi:hypothetical protein
MNTQPILSSHTLAQFTLRRFFKTASKASMAKPVETIVSLRGFAVNTYGDPTHGGNKP